MRGAARPTRHVLLFAATLLTGLAVHAEDQPLWELGVGAAALHFPDYRGSRKQRNYVLPVPVFVYHGEFFQADRERLRGLLFQNERVEMEISINGSVPVRSDENPVREGMPDLDPILEIGPSLNFKLIQSARQTLRLRLPVRGQIASDFHSIHGAGVVANPNFNLDVRLDDGWRMGFVAGALIGDRRNHGYYYDVDPEFARPGRPAYDAPGGYSGAQFIVALSRRFGPYFIGGFVKQDLLRGAAFEASPLVERRDNLSVGLAVTWVFAQSARRVPVRD